jgi:hypothetical protein
MDECRVVIVERLSVAVIRCHRTPSRGNLSHSVVRKIADIPAARATMSAEFAGSIPFSACVCASRGYLSNRTREQNSRTERLLHS